MHHFTAISTPPEVARLAGTRGRVLAVLSNAVYLRCDGGEVLGVAGAAVEDGPFTLRIGEIDLLVRLLRGQEGLAFTCSQVSLELQGLAGLALANAPRWQPELPGAIADVEPRVSAVRALLGMLEGSWCSTGACGLPAYLYGGHRSVPLLSQVPLLRANAADAGDRLLHQLADRVTGFQLAATGLNSHSASQALVSLLGLGVGLTPSGDDLVAGILAALVWQARLGTIPADFVRHLVEAVRAAAPGRTNDISVRLLWHAGEGLLYAPAIEVGAALLAGDATAVVAPAKRLLSIGHSSGADLTTGLLAGVVAGIEIESRSKVPSY